MERETFLIGIQPAFAKEFGYESCSGETVGSSIFPDLRMSRALCTSGRLASAMARVKACSLGLA